MNSTVIRSVGCNNMINGYKITLYSDEVNYLNPYWGTVYWGGWGVGSEIKRNKDFR